MRDTVKTVEETEALGCTQRLYYCICLELAIQLCGSGGQL